MLDVLLFAMKALFGSPSQIQLAVATVLLVAVVESSGSASQSQPAVLPQLRLVEGTYFLAFLGPIDPLAKRIWRTFVLKEASFHQGSLHLPKWSWSRMERVILIAWSQAVMEAQAGTSSQRAWPAAVPLQCSPAFLRATC